MKQPENERGISIAEVQTAYHVLVSQTETIPVAVPARWWHKDGFLACVRVQQTSALLLLYPNKLTGVALDMQSGTSEEYALTQAGYIAELLRAKRLPDPPPAGGFQPLLRHARDDRQEKKGQDEYDV